MFDMKSHHQNMIGILLIKNKPEKTCGAISKESIIFCNEFINLSHEGSLHT